MTLITFQDGKPVLRDGKVGTEQGCCCCVPCACGKCVSYSFVVLGDQTLEPPPEPVTTSYTTYAVEDSCPPKQPCFDFEYIADPVEGQLGPGCGSAAWSYVCESFNEMDYFLSRSRGGAPCARIRCDASGNYFLDVCVFNTCFGPDVTGGGRLTRKSYALTLGDDGCPVAVGGEVSSSVTDWSVNFVTGQFTPGAPAASCNQECWTEEPFDFQVCDVVGFACDCNEFP